MSEPWSQSSDRTTILFSVQHVSWCNRGVFRAQKIAACSCTLWHYWPKIDRFMVCLALYHGHCCCLPHGVLVTRPQSRDKKALRLFGILNQLPRSKIPNCSTQKKFKHGRFWNSANWSTQLEARVQDQKTKYPHFCSNKQTIANSNTCLITNPYSKKLFFLYKCLSSYTRCVSLNKLDLNNFYIEFF